MPGVHALSVLFAFLFFIRFKEKKNVEENESNSKKTLKDGIKVLSDDPVSKADAGCGFKLFLIKEINASTASISAI